MIFRSRETFLDLINSKSFCVNASVTTTKKSIWRHTYAKNKSVSKKSVIGITANLNILYEFDSSEYTNIGLLDTRACSLGNLMLDARKDSASARSSLNAQKTSTRARSLFR